jgi:hypothetical protein
VPAALTNQFEQAASGMLIMFMELKVLYQMIDAGGQ